MATKAQPHFLSSKRVIVAGAGLSGLSFALALRKLWDADIHGPAPLVLVVERDAAPHSRGPVSTGSSTTNYNDGNDNGSDKAAGNLGRDGYSLSLSGFNRDGGLVALRDLGLLEDVLSRAVLVSSTGNDGGPGERPGAGAFKIWTADWAELLSLAPKPYQGLPTGTIRIARRELRRTMLDAAVDAAGAGESVNGAKARPSISLRWATVCIGAEKGDPGPDGMSTVQVRVCPAETYQSTGADGDTQQATTTIEADFLIVADGSRSKLRASLRPHDAALRYTGRVAGRGHCDLCRWQHPPARRQELGPDALGWPLDRRRNWRHVLLLACRQSQGAVGAQLA